MQHNQQSPSDKEQRYRLYIDESGDHVFRQLDEEAHRYLCILGCWFRADQYRDFHRQLEAFKQAHVPHNPDEPLILHREDIINRRGPFWRLRDSTASAAFDVGLLRVVSSAQYAIVAVVIDKKRLYEAYDAPAHPYHLAIGFMLQRYCGYLNHINRHGDVMAESRGAKENRLLGASYEWCYERGVWGYTPASAIQQALTTRKLKIEQKSANIAGLQLADVLSNPVRRGILLEMGEIADEPSRFAAQMIEVAEHKFNRHLYTGQVWGYGKVFYPKPK